MARRDVRLRRGTAIIALICALTAGAIAVAILTGGLAPAWSPVMIALLTVTVVALALSARYSQLAAAKSRRRGAQ